MKLPLLRHHPVLYAAFAALSCSLTAPACAQSSVSVHGLIDLSVGQFQAPGGERDRAVESGRMSTSYLGFKGSEDLGGGVKAVFAIEHFLRPDSGAAGRFTGDAFWARNAYVGLSGEFGTTTLGRQSTPLFLATQQFNPFGESFGFSPSVKHYHADALLGDRAWSNSLGYRSHSQDGFSASVLGSLSEGSASAKGRNLGASALYQGEAFSASLAWQDVRNAAPSAFPALVDKQTAFQFGAAYDLGPAKLYGQLGRVKTASAAADARATLYALGVSAGVGPGQVLAAYGYSKTEAATDNTLRTLTLGYDHPLSKRTDAYVVYMNDRATGLDDGDTCALGVRHQF